MRSLRRRALAASLASVLVLSLAACGSSDSGSDGAADKSTTTSATDNGDKLPGQDETTTTAGDSGSGDPASNPGKETLANGEAAADKTITFTADDTFDPSELTVKAGELFTFKSADGTNAVTFNGSDTYTISGGLIESFTLDTPGTYTVKEDLTGATMTITVE